MVEGRVERAGEEMEMAEAEGAEEAETEEAEAEAKGGAEEAETEAEAAVEARIRTPISDTHHH